MRQLFMHIVRGPINPSQGFKHGQISTRRELNRISGIRSQVHISYIITKQDENSEEKYTEKHENKGQLNQRGTRRAGL